MSNQTFNRLLNENPTFNVFEENKSAKILFNVEVPPNQELDLHINVSTSGKRETTVGYLEQRNDYEILITDPVTGKDKRSDKKLKI